MSDNTELRVGLLKQKCEHCGFYHLLDKEVQEQINQLLLKAEKSALEAVNKTDARVILYQYEDGSRVPIEQRTKQLDNQIKESE